MLAEICVRVFGFFIGNIIRLVGFVLFRIFDDFRKVFDAVFQLADGLFRFFSGGGSGGDLLFQLCDGTYLIVCLCSNL